MVEDFKAEQGSKLPSKYNEPHVFETKTTKPYMKGDHAPSLNVTSIRNLKTEPTNPKVPLRQGRSPLDWASLRASGKDLRGIDATQPLRITTSMLMEHRSCESAWVALGGRVYNITPYLEYHPGGVGILMKHAGTDATKAFQQAHSWINFHAMLENCFIGFYMGQRR